MRVSLITYRDLAELDPDDQLLKAALEERGFEVQGLVWDDERIDWTQAGVCILRSTWDYHLYYEKFCTWLDRLSRLTTVWNTVELIKWNSRKTYLQELADAGLDVIPTVFVSEKDRVPFSKIMQERQWAEAVIKPSVGLCTAGVKRVGNSENEIRAGEAHIDSLLPQGEVMIQEFLPSVEGYGERALCFIDGKYSHCVRKAPFQKLAVAGQAGETAVAASAEEIDVARQVIAHLKEAPLYARVDLVQDKNERPLLMELELVEPSLFLQTNSSAAAALADAISSRVSCCKS